MEDVPEMIDLLRRNSPCWCGSGDKYKRCHRLADREGYKETGASVESAGAARAGLSADEMLGLMPRRRMVRPPKTVGEDENGLVVLWLYQGMTLEMRRVEVGRSEMYRVVAVYMPKIKETD
jgi:hypothetical protein